MTLDRRMQIKHITTPDQNYWAQCSPAERLSALAELRREFEGWTVDSEPPLPRAVRVIRMSDAWD